MLSGKKCFDNLNMFVLADRIGKHQFTVRDEKEIPNKKLKVFNKFKSYAAEKEKKRMKLANVGTSKGKVRDQLKQDKEFLKKLSAEFSTKEPVKNR